MKILLKSRIHTAVAAGLMGLAAVSAQVQAQTEMGPNVSRANIGQALLFPYYTVNGGYSTTFNVINTSDKTLAVKVRFHEMKNSRDVLDFNVVMSPYDSWTAWVQNSDFGPELKTVDRSCTSPLSVRDPDIPVYASNQAYTAPFADGGGAGANRMREGYVEVLLMGEAADENAPVPSNAVHVNGEPVDCAAVDAAFVATTSNWQEDTNPLDYPSGTPAITNSLPGSGDPAARDDFVAPTGNWLKGNVGWLNAKTGYGAGSEAIAVEDWAQDNYVTAQQFPWFLEPTFATGTTLWTVTGVTAFETAVQASATVNEWANNPNNGARTDWVITFPTKAYHVDRFNDQIQAAVSKYRNSPPASDPLVDITATEPTAIPPFEFAFGAVSADDGTAISPVTVLWDHFDREEGTATVASEGTTISPAPPKPVVSIELDYEANVVTFADTSVFRSNFAVPSGVADALPFATSGWSRLAFSEALDPTTGLYGLPVAAFAFRTVDRTLDGQAYVSGYLPPSDTQPQPVE